MWGMIAMMKKMLRTIICVTFILVFCSFTVSGDTNRFTVGFLEFARPSSLTNSSVKYIAEELSGTWLSEDAVQSMGDMNETELKALNTMHLLRDGSVVDKYNNGPMVKQYEVKSGKLVVTSYLESDYNMGESETDKKYYSILNDNGDYKIVSETGRIYVKISPDEYAKIVK